MTIMIIMKVCNNLKIKSPFRGWVMNAIILSAIWGVVMMFGGVFFKKASAPKYWAIAGHQHNLNSKYC